MNGSTPGIEALQERSGLSGILSSAGAERQARLEASLLDGVEDDPTTIALVESIIHEGNGEVVLSCRTLAEARSYPRGDAAADCVLLEWNLADGDSTCLLEALRARGTRVIYTGPAGLPDGVRAHHSGVTVLHKPVQSSRRIAELRRAARADS